MTVIYSAAWVVPVSAPPIRNGSLAVEREHIVAVGPSNVLTSRFPAAQVRNFPQAVIVPGFVNAHSHLELTAMRGFLDDMEGNFALWLKKLTRARLELMTAEDLYASAAMGACEAARAGITCLGDASSSSIASMTALRDVGLRGIVFQESFGPDPRLAGENFSKLAAEVTRMRALETSMVQAGVSPHAPYTVSAPQLKLISEYAQKERLPLMMHAAESQAEHLLLRDGSGPFASGLTERGIQWKQPEVSPIQYLKQHGILDASALLAHCVHVDDADVEIMAASNTRIAHCPTSNSKLGHGRAPLKRFLARGLTVGLGTDSVASNNACDLIAEARLATLLTRLDDFDTPTHAITASRALEMATLGGAHALGLARQSGELSEGLQADFAVVSLRGTHQLPVYDPLVAIVFSSSSQDVFLTVAAGREIFRDGKITTVDENELRERLNAVGEKLRVGQL